MRVLAATVLLLWSVAAEAEATLRFLRRDASPYKRYSGLRARDDSIRRVYLHDQTVAVVELSPSQQMLSCEFIEAYKPEEVADTLASLRNVAQHITMKFDEMTRLMAECDDLNSTLDATEPPPQSGDRGSRTFNTFSLLNGIVPGTKWCGVGDLAKTYHDLGSDARVDKCCRTHDICPVKVRGHDTRYNITNSSFISKSHCDCDKRLYKCLKASRTQIAETMGGIYFNILRVQCVDEVDPDSCRGGSCIPARRFRSLLMRY